MRALLLAAGFGTRLAPITDTLPKCLVEIGSVPLLDYWVYQLIEAGIEKILINTHYLPEQVRHYAKNSKYTDQISLVHEDVLLGTAGTILKNKDFFDNKPFFVAHSDNLISCDFSDFIETHGKRSKDIEMTMMSFTTDAPKNCGILVVDEKNTLIEFHEKVENPPSNHASGAVYVFEPSLFDFLETSLPKGGDISLDVIPSHMGKIQVWHNDDYLRDIGTLASLDKAQEDLARHPKLSQLRKHNNFRP